MATSFSDLKRSRNSLKDKIASEAEKITSGNSFQDDRMWQPTLDQAGNGMATIRFLPPSKGEDVPWVRTFSHGFQGPGGWYIENSLTTLNQDDPCTEYNSKLWNRGDDEGKKQASKQKRRMNYYANVYVVNDPGNPANNGKVFMYRFGKKIFDKINEAMHPEFEDETPMNPFDLWNGANFKLKVRRVEKFPNYDKSEFEAPSELLDGDDEALAKVWESQYQLQDLLDPKNFKSYAELEARLKRVLGETQTDTRTAEEYEEAPATEEAKMPWDDNEDTLSSSSSVDDDDDLKFFDDLK